MKKYLIIFLFIFNLLAQVNLVYAAQDYTQGGKNPVSSEITKYLCTPEIKSSNPLFACINQIYKFTLAICSVIAVFFIVLAGFRYMSAEGSQETVDKAKDMLVTTITALVILFAGYILLRAINPDLIEFKSIQPTSVTGQPAAPPAGACNNCVDLASMNIPLKAGQGTQANTALATKLQKLSQTNHNWQVNEVYPPVVTHGDPCHSDGTCADIALTVTPTSQNLAQFCTDAKSAGLSVYNEYDAQITGSDGSNPAFAACGQSQNPPTRSGNNLHVQ